MTVCPKLTHRPKLKQRVRPVLGLHASRLNYKPEDEPGHQAREEERRGEAIPLIEWPVATRAAAADFAGSRWASLVDGGSEKCGHGSRLDERAKEESSKEKEAAERVERVACGAQGVAWTRSG